MRNSPRPTRPDLGGRLACAFASLFFSVPICGLAWLVVNYRLAPVDWHLDAQVLAWAVGGLAAVAFLLPRVFTTLFGGIADALFAIGRYW